MLFDGLGKHRCLFRAVACRPLQPQHHRSSPSSLRPCLGTAQHTAFQTQWLNPLDNTWKEPLCSERSEFERTTTAAPAIEAHERVFCHGPFINSISPGTVHSFKTLFHWH